MRGRLLRAVMVVWMLVMPVRVGFAQWSPSAEVVGAWRGVAVADSGRVVPMEVFAERWGGEIGVGVRGEGAVALLLRALVDPEGLGGEGMIRWVGGVGASGAGAGGRLGIVEAVEVLRGAMEGGGAGKATTAQLAELEYKVRLLTLPGEALVVVPGREGAEWGALSDSDEASWQLDRARVGAELGDSATADAAMLELAGLLRAMQADAGVSGRALRLEVLERRLHLGMFAAVACAVVGVWALAGGRRRWGLWGHGLGVLLCGGAWGVRALAAGRLPLRNHYESMLSLSLLVVAVSFAVAAMSKRGSRSAMVGGCLGGGVVLLIAHGLPVPGRVISSEAGILDSSSLLTAHVSTILLSYAVLTLGALAAVRVLVGGGGDGAGGDGAEGGGAAGGVRGGAARVMHGCALATFWTLAIGILLGAWWADRAWGRWWGFDPKETWALVTWLVYLVIVHVPVLDRRGGGEGGRGGVGRDRVVAWLSVIGFLLMLWTYFGVNLVLPSLHGYA